jgi:hypothetical protein
MSVETHVYNFTHGTITLIDGTSGTPIELVVPCDEGTLTIGPLMKTLREVATYECRGAHKSSAYTTRIYPEGSFSAMVAEFTDASTGVVADFVLQRAGYSTNVSTLGSSSGLVYMLDVKFDLEMTDHGGDADVSFTATDCRISFNFSEGDPSTFAFSFKVHGPITGDLACSE